ncbi:MAG TPA: IPT/TIG domain-containing protein [Terriglobales bacterium]|nr:IPT/TIG domain-containing protein [Terriglobales bacterium]
MGRSIRVLFRLWFCVVIAGIASGQVSVLTQHNDVARTGQNPNETILNTSNVNVSQFGKLFFRAVDGEIYAQPLYVPSLTLGGRTRNVVYVATENNSVYAFDADDPNASVPLWRVNLGTPVPSSDICTPSVSGCPYVDLTPQIGITATPVIDPGSATMYVVAKTKNTSNNTYHFFLHALDLLSGAEKFGGPAEITATNFIPLNHTNRPGLLLVNGTVYVAFGSVGDIRTWHGWIFGFTSSTLQLRVAFNATPNGSYGGVWAGGVGLAADADNVYAATGNGTFDINTGGSDYGDSVLKLSTSSGLSVADYFTPDNQSYLFSADADLGSGGPLLLPGTNLLVMAGKDGILRLINTSNMGKFNSTFNADAQEFQVSSGQVLGGFAYADSPSFGPAIYLWGPGGYLKAWKFNGSTFQTTPASQGTISNVAGESPTVPLSISSNQNQTGTGIVWAVKPASDPNHTTVAGTVYAFDANDLTHELWDSNQNASRDALGNYAKFCPPTVANGKVYLGTFSNQLVVYGLNPPAATAIAFVQVNSATPQTATASTSVPYSVAETAGDLNVVVVGWNDTVSSVSSINDSAGNAYALAVGPTTASGARQSIYYAKNIRGGSNTVTVNFNQAASYPDIRVLEYAHADTTNPLDVTAAATGSSTTANSGSATTTAANELVFAADTIATGTPGPGTGFTARIITPHDSDLAEDEFVGAPGTYSATAPLAPSGYWVMQMATFKFQSTAGGGAPGVSSISPTSGPTNGGTAVTISGSNFAAGATVTLGGTSATNVTVVSSASITATTPAHATGTVNVVVTNTDGQSATLSNGFTYTNTSPTVTSVSPNSGPTGGGTTVTIGGTNFLSGAGVSFGGTAASNVTVVNSTSITATTPAHAAGTVNLVVTNTDGQSGTLTNGFNYASTAPAINSISPASGTANGGTSVTLSGSNFNAGARVTFGGTSAANVTVVNSTSITATTPAHAAGTVNVVVTNTDGQSGTLTNGFSFTSSSASTITFVQVAAATPQGSVATVSVPYSHAQTAGNLNIVVVGWNNTTSSVGALSDSAGNSYALAVGPTTVLGGARQSIYYAKNINGGSNTVTVTFSPAAASPDIRVLEYAGCDVTSPLDVTAAGSGSSTTANSGSATTSAANELIFGADTIATGTPGPGAGFTTRIITQPDSDIAEDKTGATAGSYSASAPLSPSGYWVMQMATFKVQNSGGSPAPIVSSISPTSGSANGGTAVTITGSNFASGATVGFGGVAATNVAVASSTSITATTPAHAAGTVNVVVTNTDGQSGTLTNGFSFTSSSVSTITFVQVAAATPQGSATTVSVPYSLAQTQGNLNLVVVGWNDTSASVSSISDSAGNTYLLAIGPTTASGARQSIYYAKNIKGGSNMVTVNFSQAASSPDVRVLEYSGASTTSPLDVTAGASGSSTTANSGLATTTAANELIFAADTIATGTPGPGTGFTARIITQPDSDIAEDKIGSTAGTYSATAPVSPSGYWVMQMVTLKP